MEIKRDGMDMPTELKRINDSLQKENIIKEREIRRLSKDVVQYEQTIMSLRKEMSQINYGGISLKSSKKDAEVMAELDCLCPQSECSGDNVLALRKVNVALSEEAHALRRVCAALDEQCRAALQRTRFKDDIIREMRRQLRQAKAKLQEESAKLDGRRAQKDLVCGDHEFGRRSTSSCGGTSVVRPRRPKGKKRDVRPEMDTDTPLHPDSESDGREPRVDRSGGDDDGSIKSN